MSNPTTSESFQIRGSQLLDRVKELIHEGNIRRIVIKQDTRIIAEFPLTLGVVGTVIAPVLAAVGVLAALLTDCTLEVDRVDVAETADSEPVAATSLLAGSDEPDH